MSAATTRTYLIAYQATIAGQQAVMSALTNQQQAVQGLTVTTGALVKQNEGLHNSFNYLTARALKTIIVWSALRAAMMLVVRTVKNAIQANIDLDAGLARIRTVMQGTSAEINSSMLKISDTIKTTAMSTGLSMKELSETFYFLQTSALSAKEAMEAFVPTVNLMIGAGSKGEQTAKSLSGIYKTMGNSIKGNLSASQKMVKISDLLAYTYATQQVELKELLEGYGKLAPALVGVEDDFTSMITMLGFLNTRLLKGGRAGRLTSTAIMQMTKNVEKFNSVLGISFDPSKPLAFLESVEKIKDALGDTTNLTVKQQKAIGELYAKRASQPIKILINQWDALEKAIGGASLNAKGFAEKIKKIRMDTFAQQTKRVNTSLGILFNDLSSGAELGEDFSKAIKTLADFLEDLRDEAFMTGVILDTLADNLARAIGITWELQKATNPFEWAKTIIEGKSLIEILNKHKDKIFEIIDGSTGLLENYEKRTKLAKELVKDTNMLKDATTAIGSAQAKDNKYAEEIFAIEKQKNKILQSNLELYLKYVNATKEEQQRILATRKFEKMSDEEKRAFAIEYVKLKKEATDEIQRLRDIEAQKQKDLDNNVTPSLKGVLGEDFFKVPIRTMESDLAEIVEKERKIKIIADGDTYLNSLDLLSDDTQKILSTAFTEAYKNAPTMSLLFDDISESEEVKKLEGELKEKVRKGVYEGVKEGFDDGAKHIKESTQEWAKNIVAAYTAKIDANSVPTFDVTGGETSSSIEQNIYKTYEISPELHIEATIESDESIEELLEKVGEAIKNPEIVAYLKEKLKI